MTSSSILLSDSQKIQGGVKSAQPLPHLPSSPFHSNKISLAASLIKSEELPVDSIDPLLNEAVKVQNAIRTPDSPLTVIIETTYDPNGSFSAQKVGSNVLERALTDRVAIVRATEEFPPLMRRFAAVHGAPSTVIFHTHGNNDFICLGKNLIYSTKNIKEDDFNWTSKDAKIFFDGCLTGKDLVPAVALKQSQNAPKDSLKQFSGPPIEASGFLSYWHNCPEHGLGKVHLDQHLKPVETTFKGNQQVVCPHREEGKEEALQKKFHFYLNNENWLAVGKCYLLGLGVAQSYEQAVAYFEKWGLAPGQCEMVVAKAMASMPKPGTSSYNQRNQACEPIFVDYLSQDEKVLANIIEKYESTPWLNSDPLGFLPLLFFAIGVNCESLYKKSRTKKIELLEKAKLHYLKAAERGLKDALHALGLLSLKQNDRKSAIEYFTKSPIPESKKTLKSLQQLIIRKPAREPTPHFGGGRF